LIADGESGLLVQPGNPETLARGISRLLENENLRRSMGEKALRRVREHFTWEKVADRLGKVYRRVLSNPSKPVG
jgi:glycosyltransferase involved in cell wall biosynthesis